MFKIILGQKLRLIVPIKLFLYFKKRVLIGATQRGHVDLRVFLLFCRVRAVNVFLTLQSRIHRFIAFAKASVARPYARKPITFTLMILRLATNWFTVTAYLEIWRCPTFSTFQCFNIFTQKVCSFLWPLKNTFTYIKSFNETTFKL